MTFTTGHWALFLGNVTLFALPMICSPQPRLFTLGLQCMAFGARPIFRTFTLDFFAVFINVVTDRTVLNLRFVIVCVMIKDANRSFKLSKRVHFQNSIILRERGAS